MATCPICNQPGQAAIYMALPVWLCPDDRCSTLWGFWSWVPALMYTGWFMTYDGTFRGYLRGVWLFLFARPEAEE